MSTRKQKVPGPSRTKILEDRHRRAKALVTRLHAQYPDLELGKKLSDIFDSPPASPDPQLDILGTSDHTPSSGVPDTIDDKPGSTSNQHVSGRHGDKAINKIVINDRPLGSTPPPSIGEDEESMVKEDHIDDGLLFAIDRPQFHHQALLSPFSTQPQVAFHGQPAMYSQTVGSFTFPATTESSIGQVMTEVPYPEGSTWLHGDISGHFCQQIPHNITGNF
ncbi:hypothetical protein LTR84_011962 [Exophiala bonariae]|uniref:BHLH domain-containing protein n=1 Tax=Exophiala bonariae TaxID=1690606 RepID=A0AAV9MS37_9EURO|nr:hypothetical protein LTR84_011962 [Exophiala bonariae]